MKPLYTIEVYRDRKLEFRWRMIHRNGNVIADSGESYIRKVDCVRACKNMLTKWAGKTEFVDKTAGVA